MNPKKYMNFTGAHFVSIDINFLHLLTSNAKQMKFFVFSNDWLWVSCTSSLAQECKTVFGLSKGGSKMTPIPQDAPVHATKRF